MPSYATVRKGPQKVEEQSDLQAANPKIPDLALLLQPSGVTQCLINSYTVYRSPQSPW
jgi:hypothetical protein